MDVRYINPFLISTKNVFSTMLNMPLQTGKPYIKDDRLPRYDITAIIGLSGMVNGTVAISLSENVALILAGALMGEQVTEIDDDSIDALGEIANMIVGGAKKDFPADDNSISVPKVVLDRYKVAYPDGLPIISIPCDTGSGRLIIDVSFSCGKRVNRKILSEVC